jgi:hypothetical protein
MFAPTVIVVNASTADIAIDRAPRPPIGLVHEKSKRSSQDGDMLLFPFISQRLIAPRFDVAILRPHI